MFPRFYFLGDDDLLEVLGQSTSPSVIQSHLKKLFAGKIGLSLARTYCVPGSARHSARLGGKPSNRMRVPHSQRSRFSGKTACCVDSPTALPAAGMAELWSGWRRLGSPARRHGWCGLQKEAGWVAGTGCGEGESMLLHCGVDPLQWHHCEWGGRAEE